MRNLIFKFILLNITLLSSIRLYAVEIDTIPNYKGLFTINPAGNSVVQVNYRGLHLDNVSENYSAFVQLNDEFKLAEFSSIVRSQNNFGIVRINKVKANHFILNLSLFDWDLNFIHTKKYSFENIGEAFALEFFQEMCSSNDSIFFTNLNNNGFYISKKKGGEIFSDVAIDVLNNKVYFIKDIVLKNENLKRLAEKCERFQIFNNILYFKSVESDGHLVAYDLEKNTEINDVKYEHAYSLKGEKGELYLSNGFLIHRNW